MNDFIFVTTLNTFLNYNIAYSPLVNFCLLHPRFIGHTLFVLVCLYGVCSTIQIVLYKFYKQLLLLLSYLLFDHDRLEISAADTKAVFSEKEIIFLLCYVIAIYC